MSDPSIHRCEQCGVNFKVHAYVLARGGERGRFCSRKCLFANRDSGAHFWEHLDRFCLARPERPDLGPCWLWVGNRGKKGHGTTSLKTGKRILVHRLAWFLTHGKLPDLCVCHRCDNPPCCNPAHLFEGTIQDNNADMYAKGRNGQPHGEAAGQTRFTEADVREIRRLSSVGLSQRKIAEIFKTRNSTIWAILSRRTWRHVA